jgi:cytochrome c oxidase assembly protein subunit 15
VVLACATFPLLWVGGLVTTTDAGMAVPDWPNTYGYNLFLYPWQTWLAGPWDLFVEHGHRMLAASVGMITIGLLFVIIRNENRLWMCVLGFAALLLVILQGVLGGMRVLLDERTLAMAHGMTGPLFFSLAVAIAVFTSRTWMSDAAPVESRAAVPIRVLAVATAVMVYLQLVLGAVLRHVPVYAEPNAFMLAVRFHLFLAAVLTLHIGVLVWMVLRRATEVRPLRRLALAMAGLVLVQLLLGAGTWIVKFSVPAWASGWVSPMAPIQEGGWLQTHIITAHVATGSLLLVTAVALALYANRLLTSGRAVTSVNRTKLGAAV